MFGAIDSLVAKCLVATFPVGAMMRYRLLDTTRVYALEIQTGEAERAALAVRHATYYQRWLEQIDTEWSMVSPGPDRVPYFIGLNNVRAALEWCFGENGDVGTGIRLAAAAMPIFQTMSLLSECHRWSKRALVRAVGFVTRQRRGNASPGRPWKFVDVPPRGTRCSARRLEPKF